MAPLSRLVRSRGSRVLCLAQRKEQGMEGRTKWCCSTGDLKKGRPSRTNRKPLSPCGTHAAQRYVGMRPSGKVRGAPLSKTSTQYVRFSLGKFSAWENFKH